MMPFNTSNPDVSGVRNHNAASPDPTIAEELAYLHAQLGAHLTRNDAGSATGVFLVRLSLQLDALKVRAIAEEEKGLRAIDQIGAVRRVMGLGERRAAA